MGYACRWRDENLTALGRGRGECGVTGVCGAGYGRLHGFLCRRVRHAVVQGGGRAEQSAEEVEVGEKADRWVPPIGERKRERERCWHWCRRTGRSGH